MSVERVVSEALKLVKPTRSDEHRLKSVVDKVFKALKRETGGVEGISGISLEGSAAKNTWIRGREEADVFIHFERSVPREEMEKKVIETGFAAIKELGGKPRLMYAEHPYVEGSIDGVTVDIVACYDVDPPNWLSATDRTPYHTQYVLQKLRSGQEDQVRLLKGFMLGCEVYGAEIKVRGFSGYLTELLVIKYGSFIDVVKNVVKWRPPIFIDLEGYYPSIEEAFEIFGDQPLIVIDPVDKGRNVASAVSETKLSQFILASKLFLRRPSIKYFKPDVRRPGKRLIRKLGKDRNLIYLMFRLEEERPPDVLWGELKKTEEGVRKTLKRLGFEVYRSASWTDESGRCLMIFELNTLRLPFFKIHKGPPVYLETAEEFVQKWVGRGIGPWVEGSRTYVLRRREEIDAVKLLRREIEMGRVAISKGLSEYVKKAVIGEDLERLIRSAEKIPSLLRFLQTFLEARPSFLLDWNDYEGDSLPEGA